MVFLFFKRFSILPADKRSFPLFNLKKIFPEQGRVRTLPIQDKNPIIFFIDKKSYTHRNRKIQL
jgi:hypothetical protein